MSELRLFDVSCLISGSYIINAVHVTCEHPGICLLVAGRMKRKSSPSAAEDTGLGNRHCDIYGQFEFAIILNHGFVGYIAVHT